MKRKADKKPSWLEEVWDYLTDKKKGEAKHSNIAESYRMQLLESP